MGERIATDGKHLSLAGRPFTARGVTYGTFAPRLDLEPYPERWQVKADLHAMARAGLNVVRTYTVPPGDVLEAAEEAGLRLIVGLHYDDWRAERRPGRSSHRRVLDHGRRAVDAALERCGGNPAVMAISVGNEIPGDLVRLHGIERVQEILGRLADDVRAGDPTMLVTYANYPTTEYLDVEGLDFVSFNVFLERPDTLRAYLARLQTISAGRPVVISELGLAGDAHGVDAQAASLEWQLRTVDEAGCAGAIVFSWTDEWVVAGKPVEGWGFGITDAERAPKPSLEVVRRWASASVRDLRRTWPKLSVVVCTYNEERRIGRCLRSFQDTDYPDLEVIVCDDGSTDGTVELCRAFPVRLLEFPHRGLAAARNAGIEAASGEIVAFIDADAWCHPEWPYRLALSLEGDDVVATGGPNLPPKDAELVERAVALSPGGPAEVLISDDRAEHVPGCNMAFRRDALLAVGGFDPIFTTAGDDVDICWRLLDRGHRIAFAPAAEVFHHRRDTVRGYLRQQRGYGRGERLLVERHPHRFNRFGQARWAGFIYGGTGIVPRFFRPVIYQGTMGLAPYQGRVPNRSEAAMTWLAVLPLALVLAVVGLVLSAALTRWFLVAAALALVVPAAHWTAVMIRCPTGPAEPNPLALRLLVAWLHLGQPFARAWGRIAGRAAGSAPASSSPWWGDRQAWLIALERDLAARGCRVSRGRPTERYDLSITTGPLLLGRLTTAVAWGWLPRHRLTFRPRIAALGTLSLGIALLATGRWQGWLAVAAVAAALVIEAIVLRIHVERAVRITTEGVGP